MIEEPLYVIELECDACLVGAGGYSDGQCYSTPFPTEIIEEHHISRLEAANIVMAAKTLIPHEAHNMEIRITTDNMSAMYAINTGRTRDPVMAACSRELWLFAAVRQLCITVNHAPGATLVLADALSRRHHSPHHAAIASEIIRKRGLTEIDCININDILTNDF